MGAQCLTVADSHLGLWGASAQLHPASAGQRCCNHKMVNVLDAALGGGSAAADDVRRVARGAADAVRGVVSAGWMHLPAADIVQSPFAAVRPRTTAAKRHKKVEHAISLIWKVAGVAQRAFWRLNALELLPAVYAGVTYSDGVTVTPLGRGIAA